MDDSLNHEKKQIHHCATCHREIIDENYIQCTFCKGFIQCLECYAYGMEKDQHVREHPVILMDPSTSPLFSKDWRIEEELHLINSVALCGIGNWDDISNQIKTKSSLECEVHYFSTYFDCPTAPYPDITLPPKDPTPLPPALPFDTRPQESCPSDGNERILLYQNRKDKVLPAEISGYMPQRHEFEEEFNDEADHIINEIEFSDDMEPEKFEQNCKSLELYNSQIIERSIRTSVVEEWKLQYEKFKNLGGSTAKEKEIDSIILTLAQFIHKENTKKMANLFHQLIRNEGIIESRIQWKKNGVQSHQEGFFLNKLEGLTKDKKVQESDFSKWNKTIQEYLQDKVQTPTDDEKLLSERESEFCKNELIDAPIYSAIKDLFIREYTARDRLTKEEALKMIPDMQKNGELVYDLLVSLGWISS